MCDAANWGLNAAPVRGALCADARVKKILHRETPRLNNTPNRIVD